MNPDLILDEPIKPEVMMQAPIKKLKERSIE